MCKVEKCTLAGSIYLSIARSLTFRTDFSSISAEIDMLRLPRSKSRLGVVIQEGRA